MEIPHSLCRCLFAPFHHSLSPILVLGLPQTIIPWFPTPPTLSHSIPPSFITLSSQTQVHCCCASPSISRLFSSLLLPEVAAPAAIVRSILLLNLNFAAAIVKCDGSVTVRVLDESLHSFAASFLFTHFPNFYGFFDGLKFIFVFLKNLCSTAIDESLFVFCCVIVLPPLFLLFLWLILASELLNCS